MRVEIENPQTDTSDSVGRSVGFLRQHPIVSIAVVALGLRIGVAVLLTRYFSGSLVLDDLTYWRLAETVAENITRIDHEYWVHLYRSTLTFSFPLSIVYGLLGPSRIAGQIMVALIGTGSAVLVWFIARKVLTPMQALVPAGIMALLPSLVIWSSLILKDAAVWTALIATALAFSNALRAKGGSEVALWMAATLTTTLALAYLRPHSLVISCIAMAMASLISVADFRWSKVAFFSLVLLIVPWVRGVGPGGWTVISSAESISEIRSANAVGANTAILDPTQVGPPSIETEPLENFSPEVRPIVESIRGLKAKKEQLKKQAEATGAQGDPEASERIAEQIANLEREIESRTIAAESLLNEEYDPTRPVGAKHIIRGLSVMLAEPYPWDTPTSASFKMAQLETVIWYPILVLAFIGLWSAKGRLIVMGYPLLYGGGALLVYALAEGNVGTAYRHRSEFVWVIALLAGLGFARLRPSKPS